MQINARHIHAHVYVSIYIYVYIWWWQRRIYLRGGGWRWRLELLLHRMEGWRYERRDTWTGLASRGRWRTDVKFLKLFLFKRKSIQSINQSDSLMVHCHFLLLLVNFPTNNIFFAGFFFFFRIVGITIDTSSFFITFISWFCGGDTLECSRTSELQRSDNCLSSSKTELDCFILIFLALNTKYLRWIIIFRFHPATFCKKEKKRKIIFS